MTTQPALTAEALRQLADLWEEYKRRQADRHSDGQYRGGQHADFDDVLRDEAKRAARLTSPAPSPAAEPTAEHQDGKCIVCGAAAQVWSEALGPRCAIHENVVIAKSAMQSAAPSPAGGGAQLMPADRKAFIDAVILRVCELPDRTSPDDQPEMMLVSGDELSNILEIVFEQLDERAPASAPPTAGENLRPYYTYTHPGECASCGEDIPDGHARNYDPKTGREWCLNCRTPQDGASPSSPSSAPDEIDELVKEWGDYTSARADEFLVTDIGDRMAAALAKLKGELKDAHEQIAADNVTMRADEEKFREDRKTIDQLRAGYHVIP